MLKLQPNPTFKTRVGISIAGQDAPAEIEVEYKYLGKGAVRDYFAGLAGKSDAEALTEIVVGWSGVDAPYDAAMLAALVDAYPAAAGDLFEAFRRELLEAKRKN